MPHYVSEICIRKAEQSQRAGADAKIFDFRTCSIMTFMGTEPLHERIQGVDDFSQVIAALGCRSGT